ncbi:gluconate 2-dehydrogenase subunit 3 family protein [Colwellia sp. 6_MG-2023]|uniref:gluconate 2-dehydrogenase subunit 3 family protein n=1 Tax=Colwellia sp. 6_MG-2023 TaxID=3062676 RepID=UPI0026E2892C|nr:gluconate 2-dehydrogenase subunit 3 family protein [Colwellia sp. 6_MG-2023]MDO6488094.1 gluconate 2-dehydrogenase subunit 3 family protein [Colwellia sp. 6_MG-2023]
MNNKHESAYHNSKRQFLRGLTAIMGSVAISQLTSTNALASAFKYEAQANSTLTNGKLFSQAEMQILHDICAVVLPATDTPSAAELDAHGFLDHQLNACHSKAQQADAKTIVNKINKQSQVNFSQAFTKITADQQTALLVALESQTLGFNSQDKEQFKDLKALLIFGYFTTEVGATQALNYQAVPGGFKGSVSYSSLKKAWGSLAYY